MNSLTLVLIAIVVFVVGYLTYGRWLSKEWGLDPKRPTPAHTRNDGVDYMPAKAPVLLGHHFSSIAGAGPILGPIGAAIFGWLPVFLWILVGSVFFGGVHDMGALFASVRHDGKSLGEVIGETMGNKGKKLFALFSWLTLILVVAAFVNVCANTFVATPSAATSSLLFIALAVGFGFLVYRRGAGLAISSIIGVTLLFVCIWLGIKFPLAMSKEFWMIFLLGYIFVASITPVWILLQPRDYLNSFLLYAMLIGGILGIFLFRPTMELAAVTSFKLGEGTSAKYLFPMLFVTVACGAISGFHSLVGSGTTSKQLDSEKDVQLVGYGSMLIEGVLAVVAIITASYLSKEGLAETLGNGGPINVFASGLGHFMENGFGLSFSIGQTFTALAISAFALTSLDTATRLARFIFQEFFETKDASAPNPLTNRYISTGITVALGGFLAFKGWQMIWPVFGSANQLLAAIALLALAAWLKQSGRKYKMALYPTIFMFAVTLTALVLLFVSNITGGGSIILAGFAAVLFVLAIVLILEAKKAFVK